MPLKIAAVHLLLVSLLAAPQLAAQAAEPLQLLVEKRAVLILRHAQTTPGTGDPPDFTLDDCGTQRNLSARGRDQARDLGERLRALGVVRAKVLSSPWCRAVETAELLDLGPVETSPLLASIWNDRIVNPDRSAELRALIAAWQGPDPLILVTHGINVSRLLDRSPGQGGGFVLLPDRGRQGGIEVLGVVP